MYLLTKKILIHVHLKATNITLKLYSNMSIHIHVARFHLELIRLEYSINKGQSIHVHVHGFD